MCQGNECGKGKGRGWRELGDVKQREDVGSGEQVKERGNVAGREGIGKTGMGGEGSRGMGGNGRVWKEK